MQAKAKDLALVALRSMLEKRGIAGAASLV
jgi:hypothetical protein